MKSFGILIICVLFMVGGIVSAQSDLPSFTYVECPFDATDGVQCGTLTVLEDRTNPAGLTLDLFVTVIPARNGNPLPDPVIYLEGGPGGAATLATYSWLEHPLRENRDLIIFDQRGNGFSLPSLNCWEYEEDVYLEDEDSYAADQACYDRLLEEGNDLNQYNSIQNAADVADLITAMGYEQVNLYGISYGTRLALSSVRDYPQLVRTAVMDSVFPPEVDVAYTDISTKWEAVDQLLIACEEDATCNEGFPTLRDDLYYLVEEWNAEPIEFLYIDEYGDEVDMTLTGEDVLDTLFDALYDTSVIPMLPLGIIYLTYAETEDDLVNGYDLIQGYWTPETWDGYDDSEDYPYDPIAESDFLVEFQEAYGDIGDSEGVFNSIHCAEEYPYADYDGALADIQSYVDAPDFLYDWLYDEIPSDVEWCGVWAVEPADAIESVRVQSDLPILLVSGRLDPVTPPSFAESAQEGLSNSQHIVIENGGHGASGEVGCGATIITAFINDPTAPLDTACIGETVEFYVE
ncbi:MAG: alpha/beta hydrolase [Phototrophicaceae bacterium]